MSSQQLSVSLAFTADTKQAVAAVKSLRQELNNLATGKNLNNKNLFSDITPEIKKAMIAASELQVKLENATNIKTGKLDLGLFQDSLKKSGVTLQQYAQQLSALGPEGKQAFSHLAQAVLQAETPIIRCSNKLKEFGTTLKNTAKWQISSSMLHGFMGAIQSAYGYAQDLNESLNNIRIVTGQSIDQMSKFAEQANKAAKALSTTTTEYTNASLIYYQQGLSDSEVQKRTDVTVKMANAAGQSAETVSNQMTAIWNNFYDGSKSLEYYADVMTALGAATASSTDEIAGGLEKFAAVGETIGLSYEYAAAALATITSNTRESEEVVGTALKTIFARIQGLKLGETLEDDVDLNKYSEALQAVGISIFDQKGELKDMDSILNEMAATWNTLSNKQQVALAQTVAGTRQYTHLVSLMKYWDNGDNDSMMANLETAYGSTGALQDQADIYAESWEAARDRVTASAEAIYTKIFNDEAFISMLDGVAKAIDGIGSMIDSLGGLKGVLFTIGAIASRIFNNEIAQGARNAVSTIQQLFPTGKRKNQETKDTVVKSMAVFKSLEENSLEDKANNTAMDREISMQQKLLSAEKNLTAEQVKQIQLQMDAVRYMDKKAVAAAKAADKAKEEVENANSLARASAKAEAIEKQRKQHKEDAKKQQKAINEKRDNAESETIKQLERTKSSIGGRKQKVIQSVQDNLKEKGISQDESSYSQSFLKELEEKTKAENERTSNAAKQLFDKIKEAGAKAAREAGETFGKEFSAELAKTGAKAEQDMQELIDIKDSGALVEVRADNLQKVSSQLSVKTTNSKGEEVYKTDKTGLNEVQEILKNRITKTREAANELAESLDNAGKDTGNVKSYITELSKLEEQLNSGKLSAEELEEILNRLSSEDDDSITDKLKYEGQQASVEASGDMHGGEAGTDGTTLGGKEYIKAKEGAESRVNLENQEFATDYMEESVNENISGGGMKDWADGIATATSAIMSLGSVITSVQGAIDVFNDPDASAWDKVFAVITTISSALPLLSTLMTTFGTTSAVAGGTAAAGMSAVMAPVLGVTAAIVALIAIVVLLADYMHKISPQGQFEAAQKAAEDAASAASAVKSEYDALIQSLSNLDSGIEKIKDLEKGTLEWRQAIIESNNSLIELLSNYGMLDSNNFITDEDGIMQITDEAREELLEKQTKALQGANNQNYAAQVNKNNAQIKNEASQTAGDLTLTRYRTDGYGNTYSYDALTENSNLSSDVGMAIAEALKTGELKSNDLLNSSKLEEVLSTVSGLYGEEVKVLANQISSSEELIKSFNELGASAAATAEANRILNNQIVESEFGDQIEKSGLSDRAQENLTNALGEDLAKKTNDLYETKYKDQYGGLSDKEVQKKYAEAMGWDADLTKNKTGNKATYYKNGKEIGTFTDETARRYLAQQEAIEQMGGDVQSYINNLTNLITVGNQIGTNVGEALGTFANGQSGDLGGLNQSDFNLFKDSVSEMQEDGTFKIGDTVIDEAYAKQLGFDTVQEFYDSIQLAIKNTEEDWEEIEVPENLVNKEQLSQEVLQSVTTTMKSVSFGPYGETAGKDFVNGLNTMVEGLNFDEQQEALKKLSAIDWSDWDAIDKASDVMKQFGKNIDVTSGYWKEFADKMRLATGATQDFVALKDSLLDIYNISKDLSTGDIVSKEDYQTLVKYNDELERFFLLQSNGDYKFLGQDSNDIVEAVVKDLQNSKTTAQTDYSLQQQGTGLKSRIQNANADDVEGNIEIAQGLMGYNSNQAGGLILEKFGYTDENIQALINNVRAAQDQVRIAEEEYNAAMAGTDEAAKLEAKENLDAAKAELSETESALMRLFEVLSEFFGTDFQQQMSDVNEQMASMATSLSDLQSMEGLDDSAYGKGLVNLGNQYASCAGEVREYQQAVKKSGADSDEAKKAAEKLAKAIKKAEWYDTGKKIANYVDQLEDLEDAEEIAQVLEDMATDLNKVFNTKSFNGDFLAKNLDLVKKAANGSVDALKKLWDLSQENFLIEAGVDIENGAGKQINDWIGSQEFDDLEIGASLDDAGMTDAFNKLLQEGQITVTEMNELLSDIGFEPQVEYKTMKLNEVQEGEVDSTQMIEIVDPTTLEVKEMTLETAQQTYGDVDAEIRIPTINGKTTTKQADPLDVTTDFTSGAASTGGSGGGSGGGGSESSPAKPMKKTKRSQMGERYKQIDDKLDHLADTMTKVQNISETLWGKKHIDNLNEQNKLLSEEIELLQQKYQEAKKYAQSDLNDLKGVASELGVSLQINPNTGDITNIESVYDQLFSKLSSLEDQYNGMSTADQQSEFQESTLDPYNDLLADFDEYLGLYYESIEMMEDLEIELQEKGIEILQNNFAMWSEEIEIRIEINEADLALIEHLLSRLEDDFYSMAEAASLMVNDQLANYMESIAMYEKGLSDLTEKYNKGEITDADYHEGLTQMRDGMLEAAEALHELDTTMKEYYEETLSAAADEMSKYTDVIEHQNSVLEHYSTMIELLGKTKDYKKINTVLEAQAINAENMAKTAKDQMEIYKTQANHWLLLQETASLQGDEKAAKDFHDYYMTALSMANEAEEEYLSNVEARAEAVKAIMENIMESLAKDLENALTGGTSFDLILSKMDKAASLREEYLTSTNKIYETEKLIRNAQKEIDKTTNEVAKRKLKNYINETKQLQKQTEVSQYELDIQQAEYDLLLAKIALEEAQNAKSTVKLQRDSAGNFGYVYTANADQIADAEQRVADAEQKMYQTAYDNANNYANQFEQLKKEMFDEVNEINEKYRNKEYESEEEYNDALITSTGYYFEKLKQIYDLYLKALNTDSRVAADAWSTVFGTSFMDINQIMDEVNSYIEKSKETMQDYNDQMNEIGAEDLGDNLENLEEVTENVVDQNTIMADQIINNLIPAIEQELTGVNDMTQAWIEQREQIEATIVSLENYVKTINQTIKDLSGLYGVNDEDWTWEEDNEPVVDVNQSGTNHSSGNKNQWGSSGNWFGSGSGWFGSSGSSWGSSSSWMNMLSGFMGMFGSGFMSFDTGGYTGEWGSYGKLAVLHEKELVLNKNDTKNYLDSMDKLYETLKLYENNLGLDRVLSNYGIDLSLNNQGLEQNVHIEANFPGVSDRSEIEMAFENLINKASQYSNRY